MATLVAMANIVPKADPNTTTNTLNTWPSFKPIAQRLLNTLDLGVVVGRMPGSCITMKGQLLRGLLSSLMGDGPTLGIGNDP
jgi:hypothetical protein